MIEETNTPQIAAGLSEAQKRAVLSAKESEWAGRTSWICQNANRVSGPLVKKGVAYLGVPAFSWNTSRRDVCLTTLGQAVRQYLKEQER